MIGRGLNVVHALKKSKKKPRKTYNKEVLHAS